MKRALPYETVKSILEEEQYLDTEFIRVAPMSDSLGEERWMIFEHDELLWRIKYIDGNSYWRSEMGQWEDQFPQVKYDATEIECEQVVAKTVTTTSYVPIPD